MTYSFDKATVLVVDDMPPMLTLVTNLLEIFGFKRILKASESDVAFDLFCKEDPDLVISDWQMEPFDGIELINKIRTDKQSPNPYVPIILMTGYSAQIRVMQARDTGVTEFLVKPFTSQDLYSRIEQVIEKPRQFVDAEDFFGPDRRRRVVKDYDGPFRREREVSGSGKKTEANQAGHKDLAQILKKLKKDSGE
jgi:CheY-like chemotaxis protein